MASFRIMHREVEVETEAETGRSGLVRRLSCVATPSINGSSSSVLAVLEPSQHALRCSRASDERYAKRPALALGANR